MAKTRKLTTEEENGELVRVDDLEPSEPNLDIRPAVEPNERFIRGVERDGLEQAIIVDQDGTIVDGKRRWRAAKMLGYEFIEVDRRSYKSEKDMRISIFAVHDTLNEPFMYKAKAAREYMELVAPALAKRIQKGKSLDQLEEDPLAKVLDATGDPNMKSYEGQSVTKLQVAGDYVGWGPQKVDQAVDILEEAETGNDLAKERISRIDSTEVPETVNSAHQKLFPATEDNTEDDRGEDPDVPHFDIDSQYAFLPVLGFNEAQAAKERYQGGDDREVTTGGRELTWWNDESIIPKHPYLLVNPVGFSTLDPRKEDFGEVLGYGDEQFVFSDSGGYQLMSRGDDAEVVLNREDNDFDNCKVYPECLLEWQVENSDAGASLDYAPYNISGKSSTPDSESYSEDWWTFLSEQMKWSAKMTGHMSSRLQELRDEGSEEAQDFQFYPVIQGKPFPEPDDPHRLVRQWHEAMEEASNVDPGGWVLKPEPSRDLGQIAFWLGYAADKLQEVDSIHVLMIGHPLGKALLMHFAMLTGQFVSSDASSYEQGGKSRKFSLGPLGSSDIQLKTNDPRTARMNDHPCRCQACSTVGREKGFEYVRQESNSAINASLNLHNLHNELELGQTIEQMLRRHEGNLVSTDGEKMGTEFWEFIVGHYDVPRINDLAKAMAYVRIAHENGLEAANENYRVPWSSEDGQTIVRRGIDTSPDLPEDPPKPEMAGGNAHIYDAASICSD